MAPILQSFSTTLLERTHILINELFPKNSESMLREVTGIIKEFEKTIINDLSGAQTVTNLFTIFEQKYNYTQKALQQLLSNNETTIQRSLQDLRDISIKNKQSETLLHEDVSKILQKMENSSSKGRISENLMLNILERLYPSSEIKYVGNQKETGDFILSRKNKCDILIENKNYNSIVKQDEVIKFMRDTEKQNCCGLFVSQKTGITFKENFEIDIQNGNVLLYVHNVNNDSDKIKVAIDVIDAFKTKLDDIQLKPENDSNVTEISCESLEDIYREYRNFITQRLQIIKDIKNTMDKTIRQIETLDFPSLDKYLTIKFASSSTTRTQILCDNCSFVAKNKQSLAAHQIKCKDMKTPALDTDTITS
jgi:hypothetical protein